MSSSLASDVGEIMDRGVLQAYSAANIVAALTYWRIGRRIVEEEQGGEERAAYGVNLIDELAKSLRPIYGDRYSARRLRDYRQFYAQLPDFEIWHSRVPNLTWTCRFRKESPPGEETATGRSSFAMGETA